MASNLLKLHFQTFKNLNPSTPSTPIKTPFLSFPFSTQNHHHRRKFISSIPPNLANGPNKTSFLVICSSLSSSSSTPPISKEDAVIQAKTCLSECLEKPLNNPKLATGKLKKLKQPRFRVEIPVSDDSPSSFSQLALSIFDNLGIKRKGSPAKILILWPNPALAEAARRAPKSNHIDHIDSASFANGTNTRILNSADVAVFLAPESSQLAVMKAVTDSLYPKPVVMFNPGWRFEEENEFGDLRTFIGSFEVIYSFMGLEVRGVLSKRRGMIFKCVRDGVVSGERWSVLVEEDGELKAVSNFKARPSIDEVETVLYNLIAVNSPITKSMKFLKDMMSSVTGKK